MSSDLMTNSQGINKERLDYYKGCIVTRDDLVLVSGSARVDYYREFGELNMAILSAKIECISKKKAIAYCQTIINSGGSDVSGDALQSYMDRCMNDYHEELRALDKKCKECREADTIPGSVMHRIRRLYRELAKKIHPDINPDPYFLPLWLMVKSAYDTADLDRLQDLKYMVEDAISKHEGKESYIPDDITPEELERRIDAIEEEIDDIIHNEPYTYKIYLENEETIAKHKDELGKELEEYKTYGRELDKALAAFKIIGGDKLQWIRI